MHGGSSSSDKVSGDFLTTRLDTALFLNVVVRNLLKNISLSIFTCKHHYVSAENPSQSNIISLYCPKADFRYLACSSHDWLLWQIAFVTMKVSAFLKNQDLSPACVMALVTICSIWFWTKTGLLWFGCLLMTGPSRVQQSIWFASLKWAPLSGQAPLSFELIIFPL